MRRRRGDREGALAGAVSVGMSRRLLATRMAEASEPTPTAAEGRNSRYRPGCTACRGGHQPEEDEHHHLAEAEVAVGAVRRRCSARQRAPTAAERQQTPRGEAARTSPTPPATPNESNAASLTVAGWGRPGPTSRTGPPGSRRCRGRRRSSRWRSRPRPAAPGSRPAPAAPSTRPRHRRTPRRRCRRRPARSQRARSGAARRRAIDRGVATRVDSHMAPANASTSTRQEPRVFSRRASPASPSRSQAALVEPDRRGVAAGPEGESTPRWPRAGRRTGATAGAAGAAAPSPAPRPTVLLPVGPTSTIRPPTYGSNAIALRVAGDVCDDGHQRRARLVHTVERVRGGRGDLELDDRERNRLRPGHGRGSVFSAGQPEPRRSVAPHLVEIGGAPPRPPPRAARRAVGCPPAGRRPARLPSSRRCRDTAGREMGSPSAISRTAADRHRASRRSSAGGWRRRARRARPGAAAPRALAG